MGACGSKTVPEEEYDVDVTTMDTVANLRLVLADAHSREAFGEYLKTQYAEEHLLFWLEVESFKSVTHDLDKRARSIYDKFIKSGAPCEVNISYEQKGSVAKEIRNMFVYSSISKRTQYAKDALLSAFTPVQEAVLELMAMSCFPLFLETPAGKKVARAVLAPTRKNTPVKKGSKGDGESEGGGSESALTKYLAEDKSCHSKIDSSLRGRDEAWLHRFISAASRLPCCICLSDMQAKDQPVAFVNKEFESVTGYSVEEIRGRNCRFLQGEGTSLDSIDAIRKAISKKKKIAVCITNYKKNGEEFINFLSMKPVLDRDFITLRYYIAVQFDVSEAQKLGQLGVDMVYIEGLFDLLPDRYV